MLFYKTMTIEIIYNVKMLFLKNDLELFNIVTLDCFTNQWRLESSKQLHYGFFLKQCGLKLVETCCLQKYGGRFC